MPLPLVDVFSSPYQKWTTRRATLEETEEIYNRTGSIADAMHVNDQLIAEIKSPFEAAKYIAKEGADNGLGNFIDDALDRSGNFSCWRKAMPSQTPSILSDYQRKYPNCDFTEVSKKINEIGSSLSPGQHLFHGGVWPGGDTLTTDRPLSASFCPQVALRNAEHRGKAYEAGEIDLFVLRVVATRSRVFAYRRKGTSLGHEKEVLFAEGAVLTLRDSCLARSDYCLRTTNGPEKHVPINVLNIDVS